MGVRWNVDPFGRERSVIVRRGRLGGSRRVAIRSGRKTGSVGADPGGALLGRALGGLEVDIIGDGGAEPAQLINEACEQLLGSIGVGGNVEAHVS